MPHMSAYVLKADRFVPAQRAAQPLADELARVSRREAAARAHEIQIAGAEHRALFQRARRHDAAAHRARALAVGHGLALRAVAEDLVRAPNQGGEAPELAGVGGEGMIAERRGVLVQREMLLDELRALA